MAVFVMDYSYSIDIKAVSLKKKIYNLHKSIKEIKGFFIPQSHPCTISKGTKQLNEKSARRIISIHRQIRINSAPPHYGILIKTLFFFREYHARNQTFIRRTLFFSRAHTPFFRVEDVRQNSPTVINMRTQRGREEERERERE